MASSTPQGSAAFVAIVAPLMPTLQALPAAKRDAILDALHASYKLGKARAYTLAGLARLAPHEPS